MIAYVVSLPFAPSAAPLAVYEWLAAQYGAGQSLTGATSVNAYNLWTLAWPVTSDARIVLGLSLHAWGWLAFAALVVPTAGRLWHRLGKCDLVQAERLIVRAWFVVLAGFFMLATRMHERYILYALALVPPMWFCGRASRWAAATLLVTFTVTVTLVLGFYEHHWIAENATITHVLSAIDVLAFAAAAVSFLAEPDVMPA